MKTAYQKLRNEVILSVRLVAVEERFDLVFSRPLGLFFAKIAAKLNMTPTQVSVASLLTGVVGGVMFLYQDNFQLTLLGCLLVVLAGVLDSSDGQLARMTNQGSELGRIIDGIVDNIVFIAVYVFGVIYLASTMNPWLAWTLGVLGGFAHSWKSAVYEMHKSEYFYYIGRFSSSRVHFADEVKATFRRDTLFRKFVYAVYYDYCKKQEKNGFRPPEIRIKFEKLAFNDKTRDKFVSLYESAHQKTLYWWAWIGGTNVQRSAILISMLFGRFDIFLAVNFLSLIPHYIAGNYQMKKDQEILAAFSGEIPEMESTVELRSDERN
jgi:phosphatidylglycerophosphate synthase